MSRLLAVVAAAALMAGCVTVAPAPSPSPSSSASSPTSRPPVTDRPATTAPTATASPDSTSGASPDPTGSGVPATPGASLDPAVVSQIEAVIASVPAVRELEPLSEVPYGFISREQFSEDLLEIAFSEVPEETRHAEERMLKRLGLIPQDSDLDQLYVDLYSAGVLAYYRDDVKRFYIIETGEPFGAGDKVTVSHEYVHALQDQHFDLSGTRIDDLSEGDAALGQIGAIEGDATLTMQLWAQANLSPTELLEWLLEGFRQADEIDLDSIPWVLRRQLEYPYSDGYLFTQRIHADGGFEAVNASITDPPESSEQVLHPEKYAADEQPLDVTIDVEAPTGFESVYQQTMGELLMQVWVAGDEAPTSTIPGLPVDWPHAEVAAGWGGDRLEMFESADGRWIVVWETAWDTQADADEFRQRVTEVQPALGGHVVVEFADQANVVSVLIASDLETMDLVQPSR